MIHVSDTVVIIAPGYFQGQVVKVLAVKRRAKNISYRLSTTLYGKERPSYFRHQEVRKHETSELR